MKKVMFLISNLNVGGTERALINMLEFMDKNSYEVDVWLLEKKGGFLTELPEWVNLKVVEDYSKVSDWIMKPPLSVIKKLFHERKIMLALKLFLTHFIFKITKDRTKYYNVVLSQMADVEKTYDAAVAYSGPMDFITLYILKKVRAKEKIQWIHFDVSKFGFSTKLADRNYRFFSQIAVVSKAAAEKLIEKIPRMKNKIKVIPNFLPEKLCLQKASEYNPYDENDNSKKLLTVGRLTAEKGQIIIPEVVKLLLERGIKDFVWFVVGTGKEEEKVKNKIKEYGIEKYVRMEGLTDNPYPYYSGADLYVQTSLHEGYCITIAEALLFGNYVISTDVAGAYDQIKNEETGVITKYDALLLANEVEKYIKK